jgi:hypothetical protein
MTISQKDFLDGLIASYYQKKLALSKSYVQNRTIMASIQESFLDSKPLTRNSISSVIEKIYSGNRLWDIDEMNISML